MRRRPAPAPARTPAATTGDAPAAPPTARRCADERSTATAPPSKSQRKREALTIRKLAGELVDLDAALLHRLPLDASLEAAIAAARRIPSHPARRREIQYIAKLLRQSGHAPVQAALAAIRTEARALSARQHRVEAWRDRLLREGDCALASLLAAHPDLDVPALRQCMRQAARESAFPGSRGRSCGCLSYGSARRRNRKSPAPRRCRPQWFRSSERPHFPR